MEGYPSGDVVDSRLRSYNPSARPRDWALQPPRKRLGNATEEISYNSQSEMLVLRYRYKTAATAAVICAASAPPRFRAPEGGPSECATEC